MKFILAAIFDRSSFAIMSKKKWLRKAVDLVINQIFTTLGSFGSADDCSTDIHTGNFKRVMSLIPQIKVTFSRKMVEFQQPRIGSRTRHG